jgi:hypothetical protein
LLKSSLQIGLPPITSAIRDLWDCVKTRTRETFTKRVDVADAFTTVACRTEFFAIEPKPTFRIDRSAIARQISRSEPAPHR